MSWCWLALSPQSHTEDTKPQQLFQIVSWNIFFPVQYSKNLDISALFTPTQQTSLKVEQISTKVRLKSEFKPVCRTFSHKPNFFSHYHRFTERSNWIKLLAHSIELYPWPTQQTILKTSLKVDLTPNLHHVRQIEQLNSTKLRLKLEQKSSELGVQTSFLIRCEQPYCLSIIRRLSTAILYLILSQSETMFFRGDMT